MAYHNKPNHIGLLMDYDGDVKGILQRKEASFWQTYHFLLVKDRLLVFDIDKVGCLAGF